MKTERLASTRSDGVVHVRVIPRAGRPGLAGTRDGALLVRVNAAPVDGAANAELIEIIAEAVGVPRRSVTILSGARARLKSISVAGVSAEEVTARCTRSTR